MLPLVVRIEKAAPGPHGRAGDRGPRRADDHLSDERALGDGEWAQAVRDWQDARIRKVVDGRVAPSGGGPRLCPASR